MNTVTTTGEVQRLGHQVPCEVEGCDEKTFAKVWVSPPSDPDPRNGVPMDVPVALCRTHRESLLEWTWSETEYSVREV